ncbi:3-oxoadipate enol-lactone hydrolase [Halobacteriales archaeon SW_6_65_15]|nr:MAG: 3-oxoadipate enol-lactone hydrolase [Halobacteriales archaeon SW_6_65_15]
MPYADNDGVSLYYEIDGPQGDESTREEGEAANGSDPETVALVEGLGYGRWMWRWQRERLVEVGYRVVVWDNRGTGDSDAPEGHYTVEEMASDLDAVLEAAGVEHAHVVGASMGGMIAQQHALDYDRAESLALLCTSHGGEEALDVPEETQTRMFDVPDDADEREAIRYKMKPAMTDGFWEENDDLIEDVVDWRLEGDASDDAREAQAAGVMAFDASDRLGEIEIPALVAHGTDDRVLPVENADLLHEKLPDSRLAVFENGSHLFFIERAETVNDHLLEFLNDV